MLLPPWAVVLQGKDQVTTSSVKLPANYITICTHSTWHILCTPPTSPPPCGQAFPNIYPILISSEGAHTHTHTHTYTNHIHTHMHTRMHTHKHTHTHTHTQTHTHTHAHAHTQTHTHKHTQTHTYTHTNTHTHIHTHTLCPLFNE